MTEQIPGDSPPRYSRPVFYDVNGDGHDDLIALAYYADLEYFETATDDGGFVQKTGDDNPFHVPWTSCVDHRGSKNRYADDLFDYDGTISPTLL